MNIELAFGQVNSPAHKVVSFPDTDTKKAYVEAEQRDRACKKALFDLMAATSTKEAAVLRERLGSTRYSFYKRWALNNLSSKMMSSNTEESSESFIPPDAV